MPRFINKVRKIPQIYLHSSIEIVRKMACHLNVT
jgi:hypothetical protein